MDFGATLSRAFNIVLKHRALWVLGFLASLTSGLNGAGNALGNSRGFSMPIGSSAGMPPEVERFFDQITRELGPILGALCGLVCIVLLVSLALWVISIIAQGALIGGVQQIEEEGGTTFGRAWSVGVRKFWPLLGLSLLLVLPGLLLLALFLLLFGSTLITIAAAVASGDESALAAAADGVFVLICGGGALVCVGLIYAIIAAALRTFGERAIVLEQKGVIDAVGRGWEIFRSNLGDIILLALLMLVISIVFSFVIAIVSGLLFAPALITAILSASNKGGIGAVSLALGGLTFVLVAIVAAIINAIFAAFSSAVWTLAYRQFTGASGVAAKPPPPALLPTA